VQDIKSDKQITGYSVQQAYTRISSTRLRIYKTLTANDYRKRKETESLKVTPIHFHFEDVTEHASMLIPCISVDTLYANVQMQTRCI